MNDPTFTSQDSKLQVGNGYSADRDSKESLVDEIMGIVKSVGKERTTHIDENTNLLAMGLDSLERVDVMARLQQRFPLQIPEEELMDVETCAEIADLIEEYSGDSGSAPVEVEPAIRRPETFDTTPEYYRLQALFDNTIPDGFPNPFFETHQATSRNTTELDGSELINYSGNNYLGVSGDPEITEVAVEAVRKYGTSVSASRIVSGTRPLHEELEANVSKFLGVDDTITFTSGQNTNIVTIGHLFGQNDLILHDELVHNSILLGCILSGAERRAFPHNDWKAVDKMLTELSGKYRRVVVIIEGVYSMDGDYPDLPEFIRLKKQHKNWLYVDEAHSIGAFGKTGRGLAEFYSVDRSEVDIWMGTLSKALGACGGFISGSRELIEYLKFTCPGVIYTIGLAPASAAAANEAVKMLLHDSSRIERLHENAKYFLERVKGLGVDTGPSGGTAIIPVILGNSSHAMLACRKMRQRGVSVQPIMYPAVEENGARLRFFISTLHTRDQLDKTVNALEEVLTELNPEYLNRA